MASVTFACLSAQTLAAYCGIKWTSGAILQTGMIDTLPTR